MKRIIAAKFALAPKSSRKRLFWAVAIACVLCLALVAYAASGWSTPVALSTPIPPTYYVTSPAVAINSSGAQAAAWVNEDNYLLLQVAAQDAGGAWTAAQTLTPRSGVNASTPSVAISPGGNAVAVWEVYANQGYLIQASTRQAHGSWTAATTVTQPGNSSSPRVGMDGNGNAVADWVQTTSNAGAIETANLPASGSWTSPVALSTPGASATNPTLAVNSLGDAIVGWQTTNGQILVAERRAGVWSAPISIAAAAYRQGSPYVALSDHGDAAIAWTGRGTALVATRAAGGTWSAPLTISTQSSGASARIALDGSGNAVMIFQLVKYSGNTYVYPVEALSRPAGGAWSTPVTISGANDYASSPNLVATPAGTFTAAWVDDNTYTIRAAIRPSGQSAFGAYAVLGSSTGDAHLAAAPGHTAATWIGAGPAVQDSTNATP
jgi:hypothetical protein